ncbi:MAG: ABC transporter ATP-binding protein [Fimbriimonadaceae bacterium]
MGARASRLDRNRRETDSFEKPSKLFLRLGREIRPYRRLLVFGMVLTMFQSAFGFIPPLILGDIVNRLQSGAPIDTWRYMAYVIGFATGAGLMSYAVGLVNQRLGQTFLLDIRERLYSHMQSLPLGYFERRQPGKMVSNVMNDPGTIYSLLVTNVNTMAADTVQLVLVLFVLFSISPKLALLALIATPLYIYNVWVTLKPISKTSQDIRHMRDEMFGDMQEKLTGIQVVKGFGKERWEVRSFHGLTRGLMDSNVEQSALGTRMWTTADGLGGIGQALILYFGGLMALNGQMQSGTLVMFLLYSVGYVYGPIVRTLLVLDPLARTYAALARIFRTLDTKNPILVEEGSPEIPPIQGEVAFEDVWFEYVPGVPVIKGVDLRVRKGELVAFVGFSGSGKTTLANLVMRHLDPQSGRVVVDGHDVRKVDLLSYRRQIGYVIQDSLLFDTTVMENIRYGRLDASDDEVIEAAKAANAHEAIESLPKGYDTPLGEKGIDLSQGEKQRLAIARALLADPRILILDEATSSLDSQTESLVQQALERLLSGRTSFVIAHRLSTVVRADRIVVLEDGKVTAMGKHAELLQDTDGLYARMFRQQFAVALATQNGAGES